MFRKKLTFKSKDIVGGKDLKAFRERAVDDALLPALSSTSAESLGSDLRASASALIDEVLFPGGKKAQLAAHRFVAQAGSTPVALVVFAVNEIPLFMEFDRVPAGSEAESLPQGRLVPTLFLFSAMSQLLHATPAVGSSTAATASLPALSCAIARHAFGAVPIIAHSPATQFVLENGADLMMPGVHAVADAAGVEEGALVALFVGGNANPVAIGVAAASMPAGSPPPGLTGKAVRIVHCFDDLLWRHFAKPYGVAMLQRAKAADVKPTERVISVTPAGFTPSLASPDPIILAALNEVRALSRSQQHQDAEQDQPRPDGEPAVAAAATSDAGDVSPQATDEATAVRDPVAAFVVEHRQEILEYALCEAIRRVKASMLPMPVNEFVAKWFIPCRPKGLPESAVSFKDSAYKKAIAFFNDMQERHELLVVTEAALAHALDAKASGSGGTSGVFTIDKVSKGCRRMGQHKAAYRESGVPIAEGGSALFGIADEEALAVAVAGGGAAGEQIPVERIDNVEVLYRPQRNWHAGLMFALFRVGSAPLAPLEDRVAEAPTLSETYGGEPQSSNEPPAAKEGEAHADAVSSDDESDEGADDAARYRREVEKLGLPAAAIRANYREFITSRKLLVVAGKGGHCDPASPAAAAAAPSVAPTKKGSGSGGAATARPTVKIDETFTPLWKRGAAPTECDLEELFSRCIGALHPSHRIWLDASPPIVAKQLPPPVRLIAERRGGSKTVTRAVGLAHYFGERSEEALASYLRHKLSVSVAIDRPELASGATHTKAGKRPPTELVAQGNCTKALTELLGSLGLPPSVIDVSIGKGVK